ncbi:MAG: tetratricopeptide repeat protein [Bacteroidales bacterium]|jgi:tetratricopeptide (TPR) repeat protein|nr:tetratricopeptide repeat protein [Bacteroidales bacterium]
MNKSSKKHDKKREEVIHSSNHLSRSFIERCRYFYNGQEKVINIVGIGIAIVLIAVLAYTLLYIPKQQEKAEVAIYKAERYFAMDSLTLALNGDGQYDGVLSVIDNYGNTKTGNRAKYIAGICYLKLGQYDDAIKYLKKFKSKDKLVSVQALGSLGDAYMEKNDLDNAAKYYKKAVSKNGNDLITPVYLLRLGMLCEMQGKWKDAVSYYEQLQQDYTQSYEAMDIDKRISYAKTKSQL